MSLKVTDISDLSGISETFDTMDITIMDDLANTATLTINSAGGDVTFDNTTSLALDATDPNRIYCINVKLFTNECGVGAEKEYSLTYTHTACDDLVGLTSIAKYTDNNFTTINPIADQEITAVTHPNGSIRI